MKMNAKRLVSMVLCLVMLLSVMSVTAFAMSQVEIVEAAYALEKDTALNGTYTLEGIITEIQTPYDTGWKNISVVIEVAGIEDKPILCYRLQGTGADTLAVGDTITVTGTLKNYKGTVEFDAKCNLDKVVKGDGPAIVVPTDPMEIIAAAYALEEGASLPYNAELTGVITEIGTPYDAQYKNVTVTIEVEGAEDKPIECYRLKGTGADKLAVGDTVTVYGVLKNHYGKIEFNAPSLKAVVPGPNHIELSVIPEHVATVEAAYALAEDAAMDAPATLTGFVTGVVTPFDPRYNNITVLLDVPGTTDMAITCFRMVGEGVDTVAIGDAITVTGTLKNYKGTVEFDAGCTLDSLTKGGNMPPVAPTDPVKIVEAAYKLSHNACLPYMATLTGKVIEIKTPYNEQYGNITVNIEVPGTTEMPIQCYRLTGEGVESIAVGDTITVMGLIKKFYSTVEFDSGCTLYVDESLIQTGDIDGNGSVDVNDVAMVYAHVKETSALTGKKLARADVNGDGSVNILDVCMIYAHVQGTASLA